MINIAFLYHNFFRNSEVPSLLTGYSVKLLDLIDNAWIARILA